MPLSCVRSSPALWYASADALFLHRDQINAPVFQRDAGTHEGVLTESDLASPFDAGARVTVGATLGPMYRLEGSFHGSWEWQDVQSVRNNDLNDLGTTGNLVSPFSDFADTAAILGFDYNNFASISYTSSMDGLELNIRRRLLFNVSRSMPAPKPYGSSLFMNQRAEGSFLVGIRYMQIDEQFSYLSDSNEPAGGTSNQISTATTNEMIGAQIGLQMQMSTGRRSWLDVDLKGGIFHNQVSLDSAFSTADGLGVIGGQADGADDQDATSWLGEVSVIYNHLFARNLTFRAGYTAIAAADVALASANFRDNLDNLSTGQVLVGNADDIIYHGPSIGLTWTR